MRRALAINEKTLGPDHPDVARAPVLKDTTSLCALALGSGPDLKAVHPKHAAPIPVMAHRVSAGGCRVAEFCGQWAKISPTASMLTSDRKLEEPIAVNSIP